MTTRKLSDPDYLVERMKDVATDPDGRLDTKAVVVACSKLAMMALRELARSGDEGHRRAAVSGATIAGLGFATLAADLEKKPPPPSRMDARMARLTEFDMGSEPTAVRLRHIAAEEARAGAAMFMGKPDRWYENPHWRCENGHVSTMYLKSEGIGCAVCLACYKPVWLTFPEDVEGPLPS